MAGKNSKNHVFDPLQGKDSLMPDEGYFDALPAKVMKRIRQRKQRIRYLVVTGISSAAAVVLLLIFLIPRHQQRDYNEPSSRQAYEYLLQEVKSGAIDEEELMDALVEDADKTDIPVERPEDEARDTLDYDQHIIEYLFWNETDL